VHHVDVRAGSNLRENGVRTNAAPNASESSAQADGFPIHAFSAGNASIFFLNASLTGGVFLMAQYLQVGLGHRPLAAGLGMLPWGVAPFLIGPRAGALVDRIGERPLIVGGLALQTLGLAWIALVAGADMPYWQLIAPMSVAGVGFSMALPAVTKAVVGGVAMADIGKASGAFSTMRQLGGAFGVAILVAAFAAAGDYGTAQAFTNGFAPAIGAAAGLALAGAVAAWLLPRRARAGEPRPAAVASATSTASSWR
jgi:MFS family permease